MIFLLKLRRGTIETSFLADLLPEFNAYGPPAQPQSYMRRMLAVHTSRGGCSPAKLPHDCSTRGGWCDRPGSGRSGQERRGAPRPPRLRCPPFVDACGMMGSQAQTKEAAAQQHLSVTAQSCCQERTSSFSPCNTSVLKNALACPGGTTHTHTHSQHTIITGDNPTLTHTASPRLYH